MSLSFAPGIRAREEEIANSLSHGFGLLAAVVATPFLIDRAMRHGDAGLIVGASVTACHYLAVLWYAACEKPLGTTGQQPTARIQPCPFCAA